MESGKLAKLNLQPVDKNRNAILPAFDVLFNPNSYLISKAVNWRSIVPGQADDDQEGGQKKPHIEYDAPALVFGGGQGRTLTLQLFYDATDSSILPGGKPVEDVRQLTNQIVALTRKQAKNQEEPPIVVLSWGKFPTGSDFPFTGVITSLRQNFTLFKRNGAPVRATLDLTFTEYISPERNKKEHDPESTTRVIKRGDSLSGIAAEVYGDPQQWRVIAEANGLDDPRRLSPGKRLTIP